MNFDKRELAVGVIVLAGLILIIKVMDDVKAIEMWGTAWSALRSGKSVNVSGSSYAYGNRWNTWNIKI